MREFLNKGYFNSTRDSIIREFLYCPGLQPGDGKITTSLGL
jgi:hypothetical protein